MGRAYENYATAQALHVAAHNALRRALRTAGYQGRRLDVDALGDHTRDRAVKDALSVAAETAIYLADAKAQYAAARLAAETAGRAA